MSGFRVIMMTEGRGGVAMTGGSQGLGDVRTKPQAKESRRPLEATTSTRTLQRVREYIRVVFGCPTLQRFVTAAGRRLARELPRPGSA